MLSIDACPVPAGSLLGGYAARGAFTDCYVTEIPGAFTLAEYVAAFYTTRVFKLERTILRFAVSRPSTDGQARDLAAGATDSFSAWVVEGRRQDELLLQDMRGRTRSWLMATPATSASPHLTRLYFGSAVVPVVNKATGQSELGSVFRALLGFHKLYSEVLLYSARSRLAARQR